MPTGAAFTFEELGDDFETHRRSGVSPTEDQRKIVEEVYALKSAVIRLQRLGGFGYASIPLDEFKGLLKAHPRSGRRGIARSLPHAKASSSLDVDPDPRSAPAGPSYRRRLRATHVCRFVDALEETLEFVQRNRGVAEAAEALEADYGTLQGIDFFNDLR